ncbi:unnamed protein product [Caenorhabditis angaria]|uniref:DNTTIP1 dimerisation domain-containing protein n=1 Tax=Caenorhabditis angaria TaxID=860376 RepID=A0A9P1II96_9PELO|nr:unnamed protein product [Caenorhabditis angaria]
MLDKHTGNGNGNKMNMRISILDALLSREMESSSDGSSARVNSLKQVIKKNKTDMADDAPSSLDLMRRIFQNAMTQEIHQILDRHTRTTFLPAIENLRQNGHIVDETILNQLYCNILDAAKKPFIAKVEPEPPASGFGGGFSMIDAIEAENNLKRGYESDSSDVSGISHCSDAKRRRGRPRKDEETQRLEMSPPTLNEVMMWNPERINYQTRFVTASKVSNILNWPVSMLFNKHPRMFRYSCDEEDKSQLHEIRAAGRCYLLIFDDAKQLVAPHFLQEILNCSFMLNEQLLLKIRQKSATTFEKYSNFLRNGTSQQFGGGTNGGPTFM